MELLFFKSIPLSRILQYRFGHRCATRRPPWPSPLRRCHPWSNIQDQSWPKHLVPWWMDVLVETHRPCSPMLPWLEMVYPRLAWRLIILNVSYSFYQSLRHQQTPNKQALSRPIPMPLYYYTWHHSLAVTRVPLHQESAH